MIPRISLVLLLLASPLWAMDPSEMLQDPALEARARVIDHELRCVVCQSESVASSNANWAEDARRTVRELLDGGASDDDVMDFFVARYGEFVLMSPRVSGSNWLLWAAGPLMLLTGLGLGIGYIRGRSKLTSPQEAVLSEAEAARLREIMKE
ncbi:Cytochrome c-type biogenesis protein CcmH [Roseobacter fucihabitans]|uniref:Cytochrome c-type biogenesis protein n=1 Tax=Roseobacter fucihabitans TaxID=1537242 RepID=A0ABZ2BTY4_9RHOB|nr:cytochrome c-type biogenesis protein [Roseobacter litoralis]MBC6965601.1 Cytochrome c-type biogenesis protein CcmH precursor [Roseobacter litoralis]